MNDDDSDEEYEQNHNLFFEPEDSDQKIESIYDFIERGYARETPSLFLK